MRGCRGRWGSTTWVRCVAVCLLGGGGIGVVIECIYPSPFFLHLFVSITILNPHFRTPSPTHTRMCATGNTCFLNSALQCVAATAPLRTHLLSSLHTTTGSSSSTSSTSKDDGGKEEKEGEGKGQGQGQKNAFGFGTGGAMAGCVLFGAAFFGFVYVCWSFGNLWLC